MPEALALPDVPTTTGCIYTMYAMKKSRLRVYVCVCVCVCMLNTIPSSGRINISVVVYVKNTSSVSKIFRYG